MRYIIRHIFSKASRLLLYFIAYIAASVLIVAIWGLLYWSAGRICREAFEISFKLFYGLETNTEGLPFLTVALEYIFRDIVFVSWIGASLSKLLSPVNPIYFSNVFTYDSKQETFAFRYWLMLNSGQFMYDVEIRVFVQDTEKQTGKNHMDVLWEWESKEQHLSLARGVRYAEVKDNIQNGYKLREYLNGSSKNRPQKVAIMIRGSDGDGKMYYRAKTYKKSDCRDNQKFLSILKSECSTLIPEDILSYFAKNQEVQFDNFDRVFPASVENASTSILTHRFWNKWFSFRLNMDITGWERIKTRRSEKKTK